MIRREILLAGGVPRWLLVSQVEHARLSAVLAEHGLSHFGRTMIGGEEALAAVRSELLEAIRRHDDGWAEWESQPNLDPQSHRPLSFRELPLGEALANWDGSIASAEEVGPLAAWTVAGHFVALLDNAEHEHNLVESARWLAQSNDRRASWLAEWQLLNPKLHTVRLAEEALWWLQTFDLLSLWLCAVSPAGGEIVQDWPADYHISPGSSLEMDIHAKRSAEMTNETQLTVVPWRFDSREIKLEASASVVPQRAYRDAADLLASRSPHELHWRLIST